MTRVPLVMRTARLLIRRWQRDDAPALERALAASVEDLKPWIPWRIAEPAPAAALVARIEQFNADCATEREWPLGVFRLDDDALVGGVSLHPRDAEGRVHFPRADRIEIGYWLTSSQTGQGFATEAARAALGIAQRLPGMTVIEIRCHPDNAPSIAVAQRLGFRHVWTRDDTTLLQHPVSETTKS